MQLKIIQESIRGLIPQNFYAAADQEKGIILLPSPGMTEFLSFPYCNQIRGMRDLDDFLYVVASQGNSSKVYKVDITGSYTLLGDIASGLGPVTIEFNSTHTQVAFNDGSTGQDLYVYNLNTGVFGQVTDPDFPGASSMTFQDGFLVVVKPNSIYWYISANNDFTSWGALDYVAKEGQADKLVGIISDHLEIFPMGKKTGEVWPNTGDVSFTFERTPGGIIKEGLGAANSIIAADNTIFWLNAYGQAVRLTQGYNPKIITTQKVAEEIAGFATFADAIGFPITYKGHLWLVWAFPTANTTLVFDVATGVWWRWAGGATEDRHLANCYCFWQGRHFIGGYTGGKIYELKDTVYADDGDYIRRKYMFQAPTPEDGWHSFPYLQTDWDQGVGLEDGSTPQAMLRISDDGGKTWGPDWWEAAGLVGETQTQTRWTGLGGINGYQERLYEVVVTDAIPWRLLGIKHPVEKA